MDNIQFKKLPIILTALTSFAVGFINPYGYKSVFIFFYQAGLRIRQEYQNCSQWFLLTAMESYVLLLYLLLLLL